MRHQRRTPLGHKNGERVRLASFLEIVRRLKRVRARKSLESSGLLNVGSRCVTLAFHRNTRSSSMYPRISLLIAVLFLAGCWSSAGPAVMSSVRGRSCTSSSTGARWWPIRPSGCRPRSSTTTPQGVPYYAPAMRDSQAASGVGPSEAYDVTLAMSKPAGDLDTIARLEPFPLERVDHADASQSPLQVSERFLIVEVVARHQALDPATADTEAPVADPLDPPAAVGAGAKDAMRGKVRRRGSRGLLGVGALDRHQAQQLSGELRQTGAGDRRGEDHGNVRPEVLPPSCEPALAG